MATIATQIQMTGSITNGAFGAMPIPTLTLLYSPSAGQGPQTITLAEGFNQLTPPATSLNNILLLFPAGNSATVTLKGVTGDTGLSLIPTGFLCLPLNTDTSSTFGITCSGSISGVTVLYV